MKQCITKPGTYHMSSRAAALSNAKNLRARGNGHSVDVTRFSHFHERQHNLQRDIHKTNGATLDTVW